MDVYIVYSLILIKAGKRGRNKYNAEWQKEFPWLLPAADKHSAKCSLCDATFSVEASGKYNVTSHSKVSKIYL